MTDRHQKTEQPNLELVGRLVQETRRNLANAANSETATEHHSIYGPEVPCYGVKAPQVHHIGLDLVRRTRTGGLALALELADPLWRSGNLEEGLIGAQLVNAVGRHIGGAEFEKFAVWAGSLTNRANADGLAWHLISRSLAARPSLVTKLKEWAQSNRMIYRRVGVMAFVPLVREGRFLTDAFSVITLVMEDVDPEVQDAVGQVLMEASRLQGDRVFEFLNIWKDKTSHKLLTKASDKLTVSQRAELLQGRFD